MTDFHKLLGFMAKSYALGHSVGRRVTYHAPISAHRIFERFIPEFWTPLGLLPARLDKVEMFNGQPAAYYSLIFRNPYSGLRERRAWRYVLRNGTPVQHKAFPASVR